MTVEWWARTRAIERAGRDLAHRRRLAFSGGVPVTADPTRLGAWHWMTRLAYNKEGR